MVVGVVVDVAVVNADVAVDVKAVVVELKQKKYLQRHFLKIIVCVFKTMKQLRSASDKLLLYCW